MPASSASVSDHALCQLSANQHIECQPFRWLCHASSAVSVTSSMPQDVGQNNVELWSLESGGGWIHPVSASRTAAACRDTDNVVHT